MDTPVACESVRYSGRKRIRWKKPLKRGLYLFYANTFHYTRTDRSIDTECKEKIILIATRENKRDVVCKEGHVQGNRGNEHSVKTIREKQYFRRSWSANSMYQFAIHTWNVWDKIVSMVFHVATESVTNSNGWPSVWVFAIVSNISRVNAPLLDDSKEEIMACVGCLSCIRYISPERLCTY